MVRAEDKTVLVVEDEPDVRVFLQTVLEDAGFQVITAKDGELGWEMICERRPDFISLDLMLPKRTGHRLLRDLRADRELAQIPVLIVTAHADDDLGGGPDGVLDSIIAEGPGKLLKKPVKPIDFVRCVQQALGVEEGVDLESKFDLKGQVQNLMNGAEPDALRAALEALRGR